MKYQVVKAASHSVQAWSGGKTTQLFIYPTQSSYKALDFDFRISSATVELEKSDFTVLPEVNRVLMVLDGEIVIEHNRQKKKTLRPLEIDRFDGAWDTHSLGKCTDFNLMCKGKTKGIVKGVSLAKAEHFKYTTKINTDQVFIYLFKGEISITFDGKALELNEGDFLILDLKTDIVLDLSTKLDSIIAITEVNID